MNSIKNTIIAIALLGSLPAIGMQAPCTSQEPISAPIARRKTAAMPLLLEGAAHANPVPERLRKKRKKKKLPLLIKILKQEAHKADVNRRIACYKEFCLQLVTKYRITETQKLPFPKILQLSERQKAKTIEKLKLRCSQLHSRTQAYSYIIHHFMNERAFTKTTNFFRTEKLASLPQLNQAIDAEDILIYTLQHSRCVLGALVWATEEIIKKYDVSDSTVIEDTYEDE